MTKATALAGRRTKRVFFQCVLCGQPTNAPYGTNREDRELCRQCFGKADDKRPRDLNELSGAEWARYSKSVEVYPDTRSDKQRAHGACFPKSLASQQVEIFTKPGELVFDPFLGVGTSLEAALELKRRGVGIELSPKFAKLAARDLEKLDASGKSYRVVVDDARNLLDYLGPNSVDFLLTSPPYATLLKSVKGSFAYKWREHSTLDPIANPRPYSSQPEDLGNMTYGEFLEAISVVMRAAYEALKPETYAVWVVKDYRDTNSYVPYVNLHGDVIAAGEAANFVLWDIRIYDQTKFRPLVCLGFPSRNFYLNIGHSYLVTLKKTVRA